MNYTSERSGQKAQDVLKKVEENGVKGVLCRASVTSIEESKKIVDAALQLSGTGKIDILIHKYVPFPDEQPHSHPLYVQG